MLSTNSPAKPGARKGTLYVTTSELEELHAERTRAIRECPGVRLSDDGRHVVAPESVRGILHVTRRDRDGSILAAVRVTGVRPGNAGYVRKLRIPQQGSPSERSASLNIRPLTSVR